MHSLYFFRKKGMLSNKMQRNVAASNDQLTNVIKHLRKKSNFKAIFKSRHNSPGAGLVCCHLSQSHPKKVTLDKVALLFQLSLPVV